MAHAAELVASRVLCQEMEGCLVPDRARRAWVDRVEDPSVVRVQAVFPVRALEAAVSQGRSVRDLCPCSSSLIQVHVILFERRSFVRS